MSSSQNIILAGFGGQGILFAGKLIAYSGLLDSREVSWLPSYGPEMRGGTANCSVCLSDEPIGSPLVLNPNGFIAMNQPSFDKFENVLAEGAVAVVDTTMVQRVPEIAGAKICAIPATKMAEDAGLKGLANVICVGKLFAEMNFCSEEALFASVEKCVSARKRELLGSNKEALKIGMKA